MTHDFCLQLLLSPSGPTYVLLQSKAQWKHNSHFIFQDLYFKLILQRVHVAEAAGWLMTGMYFMAKIKEHFSRSATLRYEKRQRARESFF